jgi:hypothetical protein
MTANDSATPLPGYQPTASAHAKDASSVLPGPATIALGFDGLSEPVFPPAAWLEETGLADHPLLRGLLLELPPKGSAPSPEWLNRWFEAARAILELLYVRG